MKDFNLYICIFTLILISPNCSIASSKIMERIDEIKLISEKEFLEKIGPIKKEINEFIENKSKVCSGEFSTIILQDLEIDDKERSLERSKKLSKEELKICSYEVLNIKKRYLSNIFQARKKYLIYQHKKTLKELEAIYQQFLKAL